jgi:hypothetical protein
MDKRISVVSYRAGISCVLLTIIFRAMAAFGIWLRLVPESGAGISYNTFRGAAELFLILAIAAKLMNHWQDEKG